jgi:hypothetical protein
VRWFLTTERFRARRENACEAGVTGTIRLAEAQPTQMSSKNAAEKIATWSWQGKIFSVMRAAK